MLMTLRKEFAELDKHNWMPTVRCVREGQSGWGRARRGSAPQCQPRSTEPIHRGSEHGMQRRRFALGGEARSQRYRPNVVARMAAGLGLGEGHSSDEAG